MAKYDPLRDRLALRIDGPLTLTFGEIDALVGGLPASARTYAAFWSNHPQGHVHASAWLDNGREVEALDLGAERVSFTMGSAGLA
ncbi:MAG: hypothetical protein JWN46_1981 [Acidimicrobiales bacterium]|nr:hypothetical protein [Acidimicrobiales bacterium]